jgi:molybdopterin molybdotransferase
LTPGALSLLATHGYETLAVHRRPRVAILATGDEVVPPEASPRPGQLRDSHTDFLLAAGRGLGLRFASLGIAPDNRAAMRTRISQGITSDVLLIGGGVSMGEFDFVEEILAELGCTVLFDAVAIQPGKPLVAAYHPGGLVFGLPGNPASVMVGFWLFVRPALRCLQGIPDSFWAEPLIGELASALPGAKGRDRFLSARVRVESHRLLVEPMLARGSHDVDAFARGSALVRVPAGAAPAEPGEACEILPFANWPGWTG